MGANANSSVPVAVSGGLVFQSIAAIGDHTVAITPAGVAYAWGANFDGQLGDGTTTSRPTPVAVSGGHVFRAIAGGYRHTIGLASDGAVFAWGYNLSGQLGDGTTTNRSTPVAVAGGRTYAAISAGDNHSVALTSAGAAYGWGSNGEGQLGDATQDNVRTVPVAAAGGLVFRSIRAGGLATVALDAAGAAYAWGANYAGQLGDGTRTDRLTPTAVSGGLRFRDICTGGRHTVALTATGAAYAWGSNGESQLGDGTSTLNGPNPPDRLTPGAVTGGLTFTAISCGLFYTAALTPAAAAYGWGHNPFGQLGDGTTTTQRNAPVAAAGGLTFK
jgi:alpha-tubulin suppressor-like RCC1 family protein